MIPKEVKDLYHQAQCQWHENRIAETLTILDEIERLLPDHPEVMLARAKCLLEMDRIYEARLLANRLFKVHGDRRGLDLRFRRTPNTATPIPSAHVQPRAY